MAVEWASISAAVVPIVKKYVAETAGKLATKYGEAGLARLYRGLVTDEKAISANETFVLRFNEELERVADFPTLTAAAYCQALQNFLSNSYVQSLIQAPLDGESELNSMMLAAVWSEFRTNDGAHLIEIPVGFDWPALARLYRKGIERKMLASPELRPIIQAVSALRTAEAAERTASAAERLAGPSRALDLQRYAQAIKTAFAHLKFGSIDSEWTTYEGLVRLERVFVPQSVKQALPPRELTRDYLQLLKQERREQGLELDSERFRRRQEEYAAMSCRPVMDVVRDGHSRLIVILGDPGLGKSTLLKHLALSWAEAASGPLTLFVELRRANRQAGFRTFVDYLDSGAHPLCCLPRVELRNFLLENDSVLLFDGLDEVPEGPRAAAVADIISFAQDYPKARIIVTSRVQGYFPGSPYPEQFRDAQFLQFTLQDFEAHQIQTFIELWHVEAFSDPLERKRYRDRVQIAIYNSPAIGELASNPLLLTMMAILSRTQDLPRDRSKLYERCAELLLKNWDLDKFPERKERSESRDIKDKLGPDQKMRILEQVAAAMQGERTGVAGNLISEEKLKEIVQRELIQLAVSQPWAVADDLIWMLRERNFMLSYLGDRQYAFVHRTFLEYFCARDIKYRLERTFDLTVEGLLGIYRERWYRDEWKEVLRLLCGMIGAAYAEQCLAELMAFEKDSRRQGDAAVIFAAECLQEIREIGLVANVRNHVRNALMDLAQKSKRERSENAILTLARGWKDDEGVLEFLKNCIVSGTDSALRQKTVVALARSWKTHPGAVAFLADQAADDRHGLFRYMVVKELRKISTNDEQIFSFLKDRAAMDPDPDVRYIAAEALQFDTLGSQSDEPIRGEIGISGRAAF